LQTEKVGVATHIHRQFNTQYLDQTDKQAREQKRTKRERELKLSDASRRNSSRSRTRYVIRIILKCPMCGGPIMIGEYLNLPKVPG
jgi:hypothetical protein